MKHKLLYIHIPKTAGVYLSEYIANNLNYRRILSDKTNEEQVWADYTIDELVGYVHQEDIFLHTHTLSFGWHELAPIIPWESEVQILDAIRFFKEHGWFTFAFVRHPGDILCSFYHYVYDFHKKGMDHVVAAHAPVINRSLDEFIAEHCDKPLLPNYWREIDYVAEASNESFRRFFKEHLEHDFQPGQSPSHASGSRGYEHHCAEEIISAETQRKVENSSNMQIYRQIATS